MLELTIVTTGYGKFRVLKDISVKVNSGEIVCVVGANGAGKTTLMRAISGIVPLWKGNKTFNGKDLTGWLGDPEYWKVEDGAIVGRSVEKLDTISSYGRRKSVPTS